jgi:DNA polymerase elongation subunit (family B)
MLTRNDLVNKSVIINNTLDAYTLKVNQNNYNIFTGYKLYLICIDKQGNKFVKIIDNIELFLDIRKENAKINNLLMGSYQTISEKSTRIERVNLKPFDYYAEKPIPHDRIYFKNLYNYKFINELISKNEALKDVLCQNEGYTTYYNKELQFKKINLYDNIHNNLILLTFDIEVYSSDEASMPNANVKQDEIFMICGTFHHYNSMKIIKSFIITTREIENVDKEFENAEVLYYYCKIESKLIETFINIIKNTSPDFITGFNDFCFDHPYIRDRINNFYPELLVKMYEAVNIIKFDNVDRINYDFHTYKKSMAKLSAEEMLETSYPKSDNIIFIDSRIQLRKVYPNEPKSSLNFFLDLLHLGSKDDITIQQMRRAYEKHDKKMMKDIAHYCLVDAYSCQKLLVKKQVINEAMKMGEITGITLEDALNRASGFKIFKLMTKFGLEQDPLYSFQYKKMHPNLDDENTDFCGGYVKSPDYGIKYKTPIFALDYSSLYPSVMRTYNLSHDSFIRDEELEKFKQNNIPYHTFQLTSKKINIIDHLDKPELTGIIPKILEDLLNRRKQIKKGLIAIKTKKELCMSMQSMRVEASDTLALISKEEAEKLEFEERDLDQKQKAVKVLANSIYGITGARTAGTLYRKEIAECVTMNGRRLVQESERYVESKGYNVIYCDTDTCVYDTPCLLKDIETEEILYKPLCELADNDDWIDEFNGRQFNVCTKYLVWSKNGWTKIKHIMRHKTDKTIHRVLTHTGCADVTTDHSLLDINGEKIKSTECKIKETKLYHNKYDQEWTYDYEINEEHAYLIGWFVADGFTNKKPRKYNKKNGEISIHLSYEWKIDNMNEELLKSLVKIAEKYETNNNFTIDKRKIGLTAGFKANAEHIYQIRATKNIKDISLRYRKMCYNSLNEKKVPLEILNSSPNIQKAFYEGFYMGDGHKGIYDGYKKNAFEKSGKTFMAGMCQLINNINNLYSINFRNKQLNCYTINMSENKKQYKTFNPNIIKKILDVTEKYKDTYVYDLETEDHTFQAGIGNMIVHNSNYIALKEAEFTEFEEQFKKGEINIRQLIELKINKTKEHMIKLNKEVNDHLIEFSKYKYLSMSYEEILFPSFFIAKKIYIGLEHVNVVNELDIDKNLFVRGFSIIRRNTTELTKEVIKNNLLRKLFSYEAMEKAHLDPDFNIQDIIKDEINNVVYNFDRNKYPLEYFIKNDKYSPNKKNIKVNKFVENLIKFIGTLPNDDLKLKYAIPEAGDRFEYVFINKPNSKASDGLGEIMQYPFYIDDFNAKLNYNRYFQSELTNEMGCLLCEDSKKGKRYVIKLFEMLNDGYPYLELKSYSIDELLDYKNTVKKTRQREALQDKKEKKNNQLDSIKELFLSSNATFNNNNNNNNYKLIELFGFFINEDNESIFKNIDKTVSKMDLREAHHLQSTIYKKYHNNPYKESKAKDLLLDKLTKEKNKNKKIIQTFINNNYHIIKELILEQLEKQEIILDFNNIEKINNIINTEFNKEIVESYIDNCIRIYKINEYKKYLQLIRTN